MKIRLERDRTAFEFERKPMPERRFKALCALAAAGICAGMVIAVTALCGFLGLLLAVAGLLLVAALT